MNKNFYTLFGVLVLSVLAFAYVVNVSYVPEYSPADIQIVADQDLVPTITKYSLTKSDDVAALGSMGLRTVTWKTSDYISGYGVDINLLEMTQRDPDTYIFIKTIASNVPNNGSYSWDPKEDDIGDNKYIEVVCAKDANFKQGCKSPREPVQVK